MYRCQQANPDLGEWCLLIDQDFEDINLHMNENLIQSMPVPDFLNILVKISVMNAAFIKLQVIKKNHAYGRHQLSRRVHLCRRQEDF